MIGGCVTMAQRVRVAFFFDASHVPTSRLQAGAGACVCAAYLPLQ